jgi:hypothetical protein
MQPHALEPERLGEGTDVIASLDATADDGRDGGGPLRQAPCRQRAGRGRPERRDLDRIQDRQRAPGVGIGQHDHALDRREAALLRVL